MYALFMKRLFNRRTAVLGLIICLLLLLAALLAPVIAPFDPIKDNDYMNASSQPSGLHFLGTDDYGRDIFSRVVYGARITVITALFSVAIAATIGTVLGVISGYFGKTVDSVIMRTMDALMSFPTIILAIGVMALLGPGLSNVILAVGITYIPRFARLVRGMVLSLKESEYVQAIRVLGGSDTRIMFSHILPNCISVLIVQSTVYFAYAILAETSLSFIGLGAPPPEPSWGNMLYDSRTHMTDAPWMSIFPGLAIAVTILGINLLGDGLRDVLDPKQKGR
ncbi:ABC transporter permease [Paenibacillus filicis]|uniref:ABC transporter permease n=1 Tax=Paenibacillus gyeongsangnamensis TaxID=3388067 RepID=A0ABT4Q3R7_9BACL|nr:ABC transporter permease [Paenibacillus filicis]MCZ8511520.1 ABC transporter permease [Paenibacillus filicis]